MPPAPSALAAPRALFCRLLAASLVVSLIFGALVWLSPAVRLSCLRSALWIEARAFPAHLLALQRTFDPWLPARTVILSGDSLMAMLPGHWVEARSVNFGLGAATVETVRAQLHGLRSPATARALVLLVGTNDVAHRSLADAEADLRALLAELPATLPVLLCTIPPIDPAAQTDRHLATIALFNQRWAACASARPRTRLVRVESVLADDTGRLRPTLHQGDGLHLNTEGNRLLAAQLHDALVEFAP